MRFSALDWGSEASCPRTFPPIKAEDSVRFLHWTSRVIHFTNETRRAPITSFYRYNFRCGRLTHHIPFPASLLTERHFQRALIQTYYRNPCGCDPQSNSIPDLDQQSQENLPRANRNNNRHHSGRHHGNHHHGSHDRHAHHHHSHGDGHNAGTPESRHHGSRHHRSVGSNRRRFRRHQRFEVNDVTSDEKMSEIKLLPMWKPVMPKFKVRWQNILFHHKGLDSNWK